MVHLLKLMKNFDISLLSKINNIFRFLQILPNVLFLIWDNIQSTALHLINMPC